MRLLVFPRIQILILSLLTAIELLALVTFFRNPVEGAIPHAHCKRKTDCTGDDYTMRPIRILLSFLCIGTLCCGCWSSSSLHGIIDTREGETETISPDYDLVEFNDSDVDMQEVDFEADPTNDSLEDQDGDVSDSEIADVCPTLVHEFGPVTLATGDVYAYPPDRGAGGWLIPLAENHGYTSSIFALPLSDESLTPGTPALVAEGPSGQVGWMHGFLWNGEDYIGFFNPAGFPPSIIHMVRLDAASGEPLGVSVPLDAPSESTRSTAAWWLGDELAVAYSRYITPDNEESELRYRRFDGLLNPTTMPLVLRSESSMHIGPTDLAFGGDTGLIVWWEISLDPVQQSSRYAPFDRDGVLISEGGTLECSENSGGGIQAVWVGRNYFLLYCCAHTDDENSDSYILRLDAEASPVAPAAMLVPGSGAQLPVWDGTAIDFTAYYSTPELLGHFDLFRYHPDSGVLEGPMLSREGVGTLAIGLVFRDGWLLLVWLEGPIGDTNIYTEGWRCL